MKWSDPEKAKAPLVLSDPMELKVQGGSSEPECGELALQASEPGLLIVSCNASESYSGNVPHAGASRWVRLIVGFERVGICDSAVQRERTVMNESTWQRE